ncbi:MAG: cation transporter [Actinomycetota bacterium]|nr:cation transporter [Actinomycetota bacterium]
MARTYSVPGVTCDHCKNAIESELGGVAGVASAQVDVGAKQVTVEGDAGDDEIRAAIEEAGYEVA